MKKWTITSVLLLGVLLFPNFVFAANTQLCVEGNIYEITNRGSKVTDQDLLKITTISQLEKQSTLPSGYQTSYEYPASEHSSDCSYCANPKYTCPDGSVGYGVSEEGHLCPGEGDYDYSDCSDWVSYDCTEYTCPNGGTLSGTTCIVNSGSLTKEQLAEYSYTATNLGRKCTITGNNGSYNTWKACPTDEQAYKENSNYSISKISEMVNASGGYKIDSYGRVYFRLNDTAGFNGKLVVRATNGTLRSNFNNYSLSYGISTGLIYRSELSYITKGNSVNVYLQPGNKTRLEFYLTDNGSIDCGGSYLGYMEFNVPTYLEIDNPWPSHNLCVNFKSSQYNYVPYKDILVPECYDKKISFKNTITERSLKEKIDSVIAIFKTTDSSDIKLQCAFSGNRNSYTKEYTMTLEGSTYWAASCTETLTVSYEEPKKLIAGEGFTYDTKVEIVRQCSPLKIRDVPTSPQCTYGVECYGGPYNHTGEDKAGPNEEFDSCVLACDGGKYTQNCINSCYDTVYEKDEVIPTSYGNIFSTDIKAKTLENTGFNAKVTRIETTPSGSVTTGNSYTTIGENCGDYNPDRKGYDCWTENGGYYSMGRDCENGGVNGAVCYEVFTSDSNCSPDGGEDPAERAKSDADYRDIVNMIKTYEEQEEAIMTIYDGSSKEGIITNNSKSGMVQITGGVQNYGTVTYKALGGDSYEVKKVYTVRLPQAYLSLLDNSVRYALKDDAILSSEYNGGNKYYTDIYSKAVNNWQLREWKAGYIPDIWNIHVTLEDLGTLLNNDNYTWNEIKIDCFYGLINKYICVDANDPECSESGGVDPNDPDDPIYCPDDEVCPTPTPTPNVPDDPIYCPPGEVCPTPTPNPGLDCGENDICTGGLKYMFREVDLNDLFPGRNPRWNWTYKAIVDEYGFYSNPEEIIKDIESLGNNAYKEEHMEYEIVLTRQNIRNIKRRNKELNIYLNYDLGNCTLFNGKRFCESNLLTNTSYVSSFVKVHGYGQDK